MRLRACAALAAVVLWLAPALAFAGDPAVAREQVKIGYALAQEGKCQAAIPHFEESLRLDPKPITMINLADCEEKVGKLTSAMGHWVDARARAQAEGLRQIEDEATRRATALEARFARLTLVLAPSVPKDAVVERDGVVLGPPSLGIPLPVDPGAHRIVVRASGRADAVTELQLGEREAKRLDLEAGAALVTARTGTAPPPGRERASSWASSPLVLGGFGLALVGTTVGAVTGLLALRAGDDAKVACPSLRCSREALDDVESGRMLGTVSTVSFVVAGVGAAVGVYGLVRAGSDRKAPSVGLAVGPTSFALGGRF